LPASCSAKSRLLGKDTYGAGDVRSDVRRQYSSTTVFKTPGIWSLPIRSMRTGTACSFEHADVAIEIEARGEAGLIVAPLERGTAKMSPAVRDELVTAITSGATWMQVYTRASLKALLARATAQWSKGQLSNLLYLGIINSASGRTKQDFSQYPVFPNLIADLDGTSFDPDRPGALRDLQWPLGAQNPSKREELRIRFESLMSMNMEMQNAEEADSANSPQPPRGQTSGGVASHGGAFHHGSHYSSTGAVAYLMLRLQPWSNIAHALQSGKFDNPDRLFHSLSEHFRSSTSSTGDNKEWVPDLYECAAAYRNLGRVFFGRRRERGAELVDDVVLPPWANGDSHRFVAVARHALESDAASATLHEWIDLVFGARQTGPLAIERLNTYQPLAYGEHVEAVLTSAAFSDAEKMAAVGFAANFGQTPRRVFSALHPPRVLPSAALQQSRRETAAHVDPNTIAGANEVVASPVTQHTIASRTSVVLHSAARYTVAQLPVTLLKAPAGHTLHTAVSRLITVPTMTGGRTVIVEPALCSVVGSKAEEYYLIRQCDGRLVKCGTSSGKVTAVSPFTPPCGQSVTALSVSEREEFAFVAVQSGALYVLNRQDQNAALIHQATLLGHTAPVRQIHRWDARGRVTTLDTDGIAMVWRVRRQRVDHLHTLRIPAHVASGTDDPSAAAPSTSSRGSTPIRAGASEVLGTSLPDSLEPLPVSLVSRVLQDARTPTGVPARPNPSAASLVHLAINLLDGITIGVASCAVALFDGEGTLVGYSATIGGGGAITRVAAFQLPDAPKGYQLFVTGHADGRTQLWRYSIAPSALTAASNAASHRLFEIVCLGLLGPLVDDASPVSCLIANPVSGSVAIGRDNGTVRVRSPPVDDWIDMPTESPLLRPLRMAPA